MTGPESSSPSGCNPGLAAIWRVRLDKAKAAYDLAAAEFRRLAEECRLRESDPSSTDGAIQRAIEAESEARSRYLEILKAYNELPVSGTKPPED